MESGKYSKSFSTGQSAQEKRLAHVPECYEVPPCQRPSLNSPSAQQVPVIDLTGLRMGPTHRSVVVQSIGQACHRYGFFQVNIMSYLCAN